MTLVDLFCGCGGFSLGAHKAGFKVGAAFDIDPVLTSSFTQNFRDTKLYLRDVSLLTGAEISKLVRSSVTGVFGGPPCQGFSDIGRRDASDPRRQLLGHFFRIVSEIKPLFFVMENVKGLAYSDAKEVLDAALCHVSHDFNIFGPHIFDAADFGAATKGRRLFVIGFNKQLGLEFSLNDLKPYQQGPSSVRAAIEDLGQAKFLAIDDKDFDVWRITKRGRPFDYARKMRNANGCFTGHRMVEHKPDVVKRFASVLPGQTDKVGRHPRLDWTKQCATLRAGTGADKGSRQAVRPIHPSENRVITVREAARLQGFPDRHVFHPTIWHSFRMIGNSVSPIIAEAIFSAIKAKIDGYQETPIAAE